MRRLLAIPTRKPKTIKDMKAYLIDHPVYATENNWNNGRSYSRCVKLRNINMTRKESDAAYSFLSNEEVYREIEDIVFDNFHYESKRKYIIGFNGRSGGYLVLYACKLVEDEHKTRCTKCNQLNFKADTKVCGRCHAEAMVPFKRTNVVPNGGLILGDDDIEQLSTEDLRYYTDIVWMFDKACEDACEEYIGYCMSHKLVTKTVMVPKEITVSEPIEQEEE